MSARVAAALASLLLCACGQSESAPDPVDAAVPDGGCRPQPVTTFSPVWKPPQTAPNACSDAQIDEEFRRCESASGAAAECTAFNRDPVNGVCRACLYSTEDESSYGPVVYLKNRVLTINVAGCLALRDGNLGASGCGARLQAFESCKDAACVWSCVKFDAYDACVREAGNTVCLSYVDESACKEPGIYAACTDPTTFEAFFRTMAKIFCGSGFPGSGTPDAGRGDGGGFFSDAFRTRPTRGNGDRLER